ncbi:uncharacterized protein LOC114317496 [Camellia sinensis]|uniref:uncharacterized protein LOC114317496 n=1 Tax=Camellia sinensis TaxID=4442 RepID=UPI0010367B06|nr:uncharacterized protein LOC114317496 [Camellia sinensis]
MTWLPTWKAEINSPVSPSFLFISNFKFICTKHLKTLSLSILHSLLFSAVPLCRRAPDECSFYNPDERSFSRERQAQLLKTTDDDRVSLRLHRSVCTDVNFKC